MSGVLFTILTIISLVCWIKVLILIFKRAGVGLGIVGIICGLFAFVYGWIKAGEWGIKKLMLVWSLITVISIPVSFIWSSQMQKQVEQAQKEAVQAVEKLQQEAAKEPAN